MAEPTALATHRSHHSALIEHDVKITAGIVASTIAELYIVLNPRAVKKFVTEAECIPQIGI